MTTNSKVFRSEWPKITLVEKRGKPTFMVDARKKGTNGAQKYRDTLEKAEKLANEFARDFENGGKDGVNMDACLRVFALKADELLKPFGKSVLQAAEHYCDFLRSQLTKDNSLFIRELADEWLEDKQCGNKIKLRAHTIKAIKKGRNFLMKHFKDVRIMNLQAKDVENVLDGMEIEIITKHNLSSLVSQFYNWAIEEGYCIENPCDSIDYTGEEREVEILTVEKAKEFMQLCEEKYTSLMPYHALQLFAGLRPFEAMQMKWENIHEKEGVLYVPKNITKVKDDRNVTILPNLKLWLASYKGEKKGCVTPDKNFVNILKKFRFDLGFDVALSKKVNGKTVQLRNENAKQYVPDCCRHSWASYQIGLGAHKGDVAEQMGNSIQVIKKHYKRIVPLAESKLFFAILPNEYEEKQKAETNEMRELINRV